MKWTNLRLIADRIQRDPIFEGVAFETIVDYFIEFINIIGMPELFSESISIPTEIEFTDYRFKLPDDFVSEIMITIDGHPVRAASDVYASYYNDIDKTHNNGVLDNVSDLTYRIKGDYVYISQREGKAILVYRFITVDEDGFPLLPDDSVFIKALQRYIELEYIKILFRAGKANRDVLTLAQQDYAWAVGSYESHARRLSIGSMETISRMFRSIIGRSNEFNSRFKNLGIR